MQPLRLHPRIAVIHRRSFHESTEESGSWCHLAELWATALTFVIMVVCYFISVVNRNFIKGSMP